MKDIKIEDRNGNQMIVFQDVPEDIFRKVHKILFDWNKNLSTTEDKSS